MKPVRTYFKNGQLRDESWVVDGKFHRVDGPAVQEWFGNDQLRFEVWYIEDKKVEPISDPLAWALFIAKTFGDVHGLEKFCLDNLEEKTARAILASVRIV